MRAVWKDTPADLDNFALRAGVQKFIKLTDFVSVNYLN
jgi:hypothetical protein